MTHLVRATQEPAVVRKVSDAELLDLARQGLIYSYEHTEAAAAVLAGTVFAKPKPWKDAESRAEIVEAPEPIGATAPVTDETKGA